MASDYYRVLGVERGASDDEIRRAYRSLARKHHPDANGGSPEAEARFKEIGEAYEVLRDPRKRATYDRFGSAGVGGASGVPPGGVDFGDLGDILEEVFGFGFGGRARQRAGTRRGPSPERGADMQANLKLEFEEAVFGATRTVDVVRREICDACDGSGAAPGSQPATCGTCEGMGQVRRVQQSVLGSVVNVQTCPDCQGRGQVVHSPCPDCRGRGRRQRSRTLEVEVPAGVQRGTRIRLAGEGEHGVHGGPPGDLYIALDVAPHATFRRHGDDIEVELRVNPADAALGAELAVPTLEGPETVQLPAGSQSGDTIRLAGKGVPRLRKHGRGDLIVSVFVMTPEKLTREQRDLLEKLRATLPRSEVVEQEKTSFWDRVRERFT